MEIKKALTFRASSIGDCLMGAYLLQNIHASFPDARCAIVVASRSKMIKDLLECYPWLEIIEANRRSPASLLYLYQQFRGSDLVVTQYTGKKGRKFSFLSKCMARLLAKKGGCVGFEDASSLNSFFFDTVHAVSLSLAVASHERKVLSGKKIPLSIPFPNISFAEKPGQLSRFGLLRGKFIVVHLFAGGKGRGLNPEKKKELIASLAEKTGQKIVLSGGSEDWEEAERISRGIEVVNIAGKTSLQELMNIIFESSRVISVDTGVAHIAAQLSKPLTVIRTCVAPNWWLPEQYGPHAQIDVLSADEACLGNHVYKDYPDCINSIPTKSIIETV